VLALRAAEQLFGALPASLLPRRNANGGDGDREGLEETASGQALYGIPPRGVDDLDSGWRGARRDDLWPRGERTAKVEKRPGVSTCSIRRSISVVEA